MPIPIGLDQCRRPDNFTTQVALPEHDWIHGVMMLSINTAPRYRMPDLLGACVSLVLSESERQQMLVAFMATEFVRRNRSIPLRSCELWPLQAEQLKAAQRAPWNRFPNPMFGIEHVMTGCVAVVRLLPDAQNLVLEQARDNFLARTAPTQASAN
jgi:hypothetical protein